LKQVAVYNLGPKRKREAENQPHSHLKRHSHQQYHKLLEARRKERELQKQEQKRETWVTATIDGQVVSWVNNYFGPTEAPAASPAETAAPVANAQPSPAPPPAAVPAPATPGTNGGGSEEISNDSTGNPIWSKTKHAKQGDGSGEYSRVGYYDASSQVADGITFLGNYGGQGSGRWTS
jgi:hypothetical protein